jgi:peptidoglycan hydrolase-like protein with peptidoglycan-binding domain
MGAWQNTPQGKVIAGAFMDAFNQMTIAARNYSAQRTGPNGLGTGGALAVDGARTAPAAMPAAQMTVRQAQIRLAELNFYSGAIDGDFGGGTAKALADFQRAKGLPVSSTLDAATSAALAR